MWIHDNIWPWTIQVGNQQSKSQLQEVFEMLVSFGQVKCKGKNVKTKISIIHNWDVSTIIYYLHRKKLELIH